MPLKFNLGQILATPASLQLLARHRITAFDLLSRHISGDWGNVGADDAAANDEALQSGARLLSSYAINGRGTVWIITDAVSDVDEAGNALSEPQRLTTTILLPSEY